MAAFIVKVMYSGYVLKNDAGKIIILLLQEQYTRFKQ